MDWVKTGKAFGALVGGVVQVAMDSSNTRYTSSTTYGVDHEYTAQQQQESFPSNYASQQPPPPYSQTQPQHQPPPRPPPPMGYPQYYNNNANNNNNINANNIANFMPAPPTHQHHFPQQHETLVSVSTQYRQEALHPVRILVILSGLSEFVFRAIGEAVEKSPLQSFTRDEKAVDCCLWDCGDLCWGSLKWNLLCPLMLSLGIAIRTLAGVLLGLFFAIIAVIARSIHLPIVLVFYLKSIILLSPRLGPFLKCVFFILFFIIYPLSIVFAMASAIFASIYISLAYPLNKVGMILLLSMYHTLVYGPSYQKKALAIFESDGVMYELKVFHSILALIYAFVGMIVLGVGFFFKALFETPYNVYNGVKGVWIGAFDGCGPQAERSQSSVCIDDSLCRCCAESCTQLVSLILFPFRIVATLLVFVCFILVDVLSLVYGFLYGLAIGASSVYVEPMEAVTFATIRNKLSSFSTASHFTYVEM
eukprot:m.35300 g.35300  ORF g.35300 m.35300 type:complete len:477 (+) comp6596_c0_seq2:227-1657(+)